MTLPVQTCVQNFEAMPKVIFNLLCTVEHIIWEIPFRVC